MDLFSQQETTPVVDFQLTQGQQNGFDILKEFILDQRGKYRKALLEGYAGVGKSTLINLIVEAVRKDNPHISFGMTAPTHKAVGVIRKMSLLKDQLDFGTIHSFLGLKEVQKPNPKNKSEYIIVYEPDYESKYSKKIDGINVLIVDESSMLGDDLYGHIEQAVEERGIKVLFMGDPLQLPPVGKKQATGNADAIPFLEEERQKRGILHVVLNEVVRQAADNPIIAYATAIRQQVMKQFVDYLVPEESGTGIKILQRNLEALRPVFLQYFDTPEFTEDSNYVKIICWRNATADYFNNEVRLLINKADSLPRIIRGEKLVLDKPVLKGETILIANNENLETLEVKVGTHQLKYLIIDRNSFKAAQGDDTGKKWYEVELKVYICTVRTDDKKIHAVLILHEDSEAEYNKIVDEIKAAAIKAMGFDKSEMWKQYFKIGKPFAWVKYNYALTAHKSQGSSYDYVISMEWDMMVSKDLEERNRMKYVASTRARHKLFIVK